MKAGTIQFAVDLVQRSDLTVCVLPGGLIAIVYTGVGRC